MAESKTTPAAQKAAPAVKPVTATKSAAAAKPKAAAKPVAAKKAPAAKKPVAAKKSATASLSHEERYVRVQTAAYYLAEKEGFTGNPLEHWAAAEVQITRSLQAKK